MAVGRAGTVFLALSAEPEALLRLGLWVVTAASVGERVDVLLTAGPLRAFQEGAGPPANASALGLPGPASLLAQAKGLGHVRVVSCDTEVRLAGLEDAGAMACVDELVSLPSFWRQNIGVRTVTV